MEVSRNVRKPVHCHQIKNIKTESAYFPSISWPIRLARSRRSLVPSLQSSGSGLSRERSGWRWGKWNSAGSGGPGAMVDRQRRDHEIAPDLRRDGAADDLAQRFVVVAPDPHADHQVAGKADEQGVAVVLAGAGLAEGRDGERGAAAGAAVRRRIEQVEHRRAVAARIELAAGAEQLRQALALRLIGETARDDRVAPAGDRGIGRGQLEQADPCRAQREARLVRQRGRNAEVARGADDIGAADLLRQADGRGVARPGERLAQADLAAIDAVAVDRGPAVDGDRLVLDHAVGSPAGAQSGEIDEQFERRARLPPRLGGAVEWRILVAAAADHRDHAAVGPHRHQRHLGVADRRPAHRPHREPLEVAVERRAHPDLAEIGFERLARIRRDPVGEISAGRDLRRLPHRPRRSDRRRPRAADRAGVGHRREHQPAALLRGGEMLRRRKARGRLDHAGEHRRLGQREVARLAAEIMVGRGAQTVDSVAEIDARQIAREDFLLGQPGFEPEGDDHFLRLALDRPVAGQEVGLGELLGDGRAALANAAAAHVGEHRPADPARVDAPVAVEAPVFDGDEGGRGFAGAAW